MPTVTWILVADRCRSSLFHALPNNVTPYPTLSCFTHEEGRLAPQDRDSDRPGRVVHPGGARSAVEPHEDRAHVEARRFAAQLVDQLERHRLEGRFDQLIVVAPPMFLGVLRDAWTPSLRKLIAQEVNQDLLSLSETELQKRLIQIAENSVVREATTG